MITAQIDDDGSDDRKCVQHTGCSKCCSFQNRLKTAADSANCFHWTEASNRGLSVEQPNLTYTAVNYRSRDNMTWVKAEYLSAWVCQTEKVNQFGDKNKTDTWDVVVLKNRDWYIWFMVY